MFDNISKKIKGSAKVIFWIESLGAVITGFVMSEKTNGLSLLIALLIILLALFSAWLIYGFGEIIDKLGPIQSKDTSNQESVSLSNSRANERAKRLKQLRAQGLITEEEYSDAMSKL